MKENYYKSQSGSAGVKVLAVLVVLFLIGNAGYNFIPVAYNGANLKQEMQAAVSQGATIPATTGNPIDVTKRRIQTVARASDAPVEAYIEVKSINNQANNLQARVVYTKPISILPFGIYDYQYHFDHTVNTNGFLTKQ